MPAVYEVMIERHFSAAHHLLNYEGKCERLHGHNYKVTLHARSAELDKALIAIDFKDLKQALDPLIEALDHTNLNDNPLLEGKSPSSEWIAQLLFEHIKPQVPGVYKVCVGETPNQQACYIWHD
jgi:6-pyruvoyltetrahydropterin/6-carboxytetrahydropterin synthase